MILSLLEGLSRALFLPLDQITAALCLLLAFPFAFLLHFVIFFGVNCPCRRLVTCLSILPTYLFLWISFYVARPGDAQFKLFRFIIDILSVHLPIILTYFGLKYSSFLRKNPTLIFALLLAQLSYHHLSRQLHFYNQYTVNLTGPLMVLIIKLSAFSYDVHDGEVDITKVEFDGFLGWCLLFAGFFTGPVVSYRDYENLCYRGILIKSSTGDDAKKKKNDNIVKNDNAVKDIVKPAVILTGRKRRASFLIFSAALLLILGLILQPHFPTQNLLKISESTTANIFYKLIFLHLSLVAWRLKYYVAWMLAEGSLVIIGFGMNVKEGNKIKW